MAIRINGIVSLVVAVSAGFGGGIVSNAIRSRSHGELTVGDLHAARLIASRVEVGGPDAGCTLSPSGIDCKWGKRSIVMMTVGGPLIALSGDGGPGHQVVLTAVRPALLKARPVEDVALIVLNSQPYYEPKTVNPVDLMVYLKAMGMVGAPQH